MILKDNHEIGVNIENKSLKQESSFQAYKTENCILLLLKMDMICKFLIFSPLNQSKADKIKQV